MILLLVGCLLDREGYLAARVLLSDDDQDGWSERGGDCDDADAGTHPEAPDGCDLNDNDCDGTTDEDGGTTAWYPDLDGDGYGDEATLSTACTPAEGWIALGGDCDDTRASVHPDAGEICDGEDEDCDGDVDENADGAPIWYVDADADGYTAGPDGPETACDEPDGYSAPSEVDDCDDLNATVYPDAPEVCGDGVINACEAHSECRYAGEGEPVGRVLENDLGGGIVLTQVASLSDDDAADLIFGRAEQASDYLAEIRTLEGPTSATVAASSAPHVWDGAGASITGFQVGRPGDSPFSQIVVFGDGDGDSESVRRLDGEDGTIAAAPVWLTSGSSAEFSPMAFGWDPGKDWLSWGDSPTYRLLGVDWNIAEGTSAVDITNYVTIDDLELSAAPAVCDLDGDGLDDVVVSRTGGELSRIAADIVRGALDAGDLDATIESNGFGLPSCVDDLNMDGHPELVVSAYADEDPGSTSVYILSTFPASGSLADAADTTLTADGTSTFFGLSVSTGDLDDDGTYDLAAGAVFGDAADFGGGTGGTDGGCAVVFYGPFAAGTRSANDDGAAAFCSPHDNSYFGYQVAMADDITGDGIDDLVSTAMLETASDGVSQGIVYAIPGMTP